MVERPNISVLMSVYAKEKPNYLTASLDSLVKQTVQPSEIVIVEDGKLPNELVQVIKTFEQQYPNLFLITKLVKNQGLGVALKVGLEKCHHELVARMDSDDIAVATRFETQLDLMIKQNSDICGGQIKEFSQNTKNVLAKRIVPTSNSEIIKFAHKRNPFNHMTVMFKKSKIQAIGSYRVKPGYEDYDLWIRAILNHYRLQNSPQYLVYARAGESMVTRRGGLAYVKKSISMRVSFFKSGFYSLKDLIMTSSASLVAALLPNKLRYFVYYKVLRK